MRNLIHGADTVMSHITHLYHLSALDFINTSTFPGMAPWIPCYSGVGSVEGSTGVGLALVNNYVAALEIRRKAHVIGAIFNAKHPCGSSPVLGGCTDIVTTEKRAQFARLLDEIRSFINEKYIPDVALVANAFSAYWTVGRGCLNTLSYGDFPDPSTGTLLLKRGRRDSNLTIRTVNPDDIREYVKYSYYSDATTGLHPSSGATEPDTLKMIADPPVAYTWLKAPRILATGGEANPAGSTYSSGTPIPHEVGPLARVLATYGVGTEQVSQAKNTYNTTGSVAACPVTSASPYTLTQLVDLTVSFYEATYHALPNGLTDLFSPLGRHLARALECKFLADAMGGDTGVTSWLSRLVIGNPSYTQVSIPAGFTSGAGLVEAPRGALGHWINIGDKKIFNYQCVVPTTWNASPKDDLENKGPAEWTLMGQDLDAGGAATTNERILNVLRLLHPFDFCIACAVHLVKADGKELGKASFDSYGRMTEFIVNE